MSTIEHDPKAMQFRTEVDGNHAHLDYTLAGKAMTIAHTRVPRPIEGRGIAAELMRAALSVAKKQSWEVIPACSYAVSYLKRHPQESARQHVEDLLDEALDESYPASDSPSVGGST